MQIYHSYLTTRFQIQVLVLKVAGDLLHILEFYQSNEVYINVIVEVKSIISNDDYESC